MRVLVTGSTGFVGPVVCQALLDAGHTVTAAVRALPAVLVPGCDPVTVGNIDGDTQWQGVMEQIDAVVHLAARAHENDSAGALSAYRKVNVEGSAQLARAALTAGVGTFIYMSSIKVNGESSPFDARGEPVRFSGEDEPRPATPYGHTKWAAEQSLSEIVHGTSMRLVALRPPLVYGPGQKANLLRLIRAIDAGIPLPFAGFENRRSLIDVRNLADAVVRAVASNCAAAGPYTLADIDISTPDLVRAMAMALGRRPRLFHLPVALLTAAATLSGRREQLDKLSRSLIVDSTRIAEATAWAPQRTLDESLHETVSYYRATCANR